MDNPRAGQKEFADPEGWKTDFSMAGMVPMQRPLQPMSARKNKPKGCEQNRLASRLKI